MSKKKSFKDTKVGQFLTNAAPALLGSIGDVLPNQGVLGVVKNLIEKDEVMPAKDKEEAMKLLEIDIIEMQEVSKRWQADMSSSGTWLTKNVRPITLCFFSFSYVVGWYCGYDLTSIQSVVSIIIASYFGSRVIDRDWET